MSATICRVCNESYPCPGHTCPTDKTTAQSEAEKFGIVATQDHYGFVYIGQQKFVHESELTALREKSEKLVAALEKIYFCHSTTDAWRLASKALDEFKKEN